MKQVLLLVLVFLSVNLTAHAQISQLSGGGTVADAGVGGGSAGGGAGAIAQWSSTTFYGIGDIAIYNDTVFSRNIAGTTATPPDQDIANWSAVGPNYLAQWASSTYYHVGNVVEYSGKLYSRQVAGQTAGTPLADATNWSPVSIDLADATGILAQANGGLGFDATTVTDGQLLIGDTGTGFVSASLTGTVNQVNVANGAGSITLSTPQDIHSGATPTFVSATFSGLAPSDYVVTDGSSGLSTVASIPASDVTGLTSGSVVFAGAGGELAEDATNFVWDDTNNELGIGANNPTAQVHIDAITDKEVLKVQSVNGQTANIMVVENFNASTQHFVINSAGNVGINDPSPDAALDVNGDAEFTLPALSHVHIDGATTPNTNSNGALRVEHSPGAPTNSAVYIDTTMNGFADVRGQTIDVDLMNESTASIVKGLQVQGEVENATNVDFHMLELVITGDTTTVPHGLHVNQGIKPIHQVAGDLVGPVEARSTALGVFTDETVAFGSNVTNSTIFANDNDYIYVGYSSVFKTIEVLLSTPASQNINSIIEYSQGAGSWNTLSFTDGTIGFTQSGSITFGTPGDWATDVVDGSVASYFIRIQRTRNALGTAPVESTIKVNTSVNFFWQEDGDIQARQIRPIEGIVNPVVTTAERDLFTNIEAGLQVYNSSSATMQYYDGAAWQDYAVSGAIDLSADVTGILPQANGGIGFDGTTALDGQLLIGDTGTGFVSASLTGTVNQVNVANGAGSITLSLPQDIHSGASPTFVSATFSGLAPSLPVRTDGSSGLTTGQINLASEVTGLLPASSVSYVSSSFVDSTDVQSAITELGNEKEGQGDNTHHVGPGREFSTIQAALDSFGDATVAADNFAPQTVIVDGGVYDEDLLIPGGRIVNLIANGKVVLGNGLGSNWSSTNARNITTKFENALNIAANAPRPALVIGSVVPSEATSTFVAQASGWAISGDLLINGDGSTHTIVLESVDIQGDYIKSMAGLTNLICRYSKFNNTLNSPVATILERADHCQFDSLIQVDSFNEIRHSEILGGMTVTANTDAMPPSGMFHTDFSGTFTGPANSLKVDSVTDYYLTANSAVISGSATKVLLYQTDVASMSGVLPIANGGTNSSTALNNDRMVLTSGGAIVEGGALADGQFFIGASGGAPAPGTIAGTANQVNIAYASNSITASLPQDIHAGASPSFVSASFSGVTNAFLTTDGSGNLVGVSSIDLTTDVGASVLPVANGGTNSSTALGNGRVMVSSGGAIVEDSELKTDTTSVALDVDSTVGAFMPPRMTTAQRDALTASAGMVLFNTTISQLQYYNGTGWISY